MARGELSSEHAYARFRSRSNRGRKEAGLPNRMPGSGSPDGGTGLDSPTWPAEYGGGGLSKDEFLVLQDEMLRINARAPIGGMASDDRPDAARVRE